jgi:DNA repair exonuclease SbcCD ATPase subunit
LKSMSERLMRKMLPRTAYYMQQLLPLLTSGRYHDVRLRTDEDEGTTSGGPFQLRVWDTAAGEYVPRSALSGGVTDQLSLALRLAFAIAALPRELVAAPGFVVLDEPLSSFDRSRTQALVNVVTGEILGQHFEQILFVSHSSAFDPAMFPYHIYMDNGVVVESNLPVVASFPALAINGSGSEAQQESKSEGEKEEDGEMIEAEPASVGAEI